MVRLAIVVWGFLLLPGAAAGLSIVSVERGIAVGAEVFIDGEVFEDVDLEVSDQPREFIDGRSAEVDIVDIASAAANATQTSFVDQDSSDSLGIRATGLAGAAFDVFDPGFPTTAEGIAESALSVTFEIERDARFNLDLVLVADLVNRSVFSPQGDALAGMIAEFVLDGALFQLAALDETEGGLPIERVLEASGVLAAGVYTLDVRAFANAAGIEDALSFGTAEFELDFSLREIPEPRTGILVGIGLWILARRRRGTQRLHE